MAPKSPCREQIRPLVTGNTLLTEPENRTFYPALDGIRAIAFLMVFFQHYLMLPWGWSGVDLFFVLSGFLITGILFDTCHDPYRVRNFYVRRTLRIMPLYYGIMLALLALQPLIHWQWNWKWLVWPLYLGNFARFFHPSVDGDMLQHLADFQPRGQIGLQPVKLFLGHFWSLCVEEQFYFLWPWVVFWMRDRVKLMWTCAATLPFCLILRLSAQSGLPSWMLEKELLYRATPFRVDALLIGGLIALLLRGPAKTKILLAARRLLPFVLGVIFLWLIFNPYTRIWQRPYIYPSWHFTWGLSVIDVTSTILILAAIQPASLAYQVFSLRPLRWLGRISYGAYVLHDIPHPAYLRIARGIVAFLEKNRGIAEHNLQRQATLLAAVIGLVMTVLLSWLSFRYYESFFLNFKERWTIRVEESTLPPPAYAAAAAGRQSTQ